MIRRTAPMTPESQFLANLPLIERLIEYTCRRAHCPAQEAEEFAAWAKLRFVSDDYGILRKFEGKSALSTYLSVVLQRLFLDFRVERWGKWRPSAEAKRMGPLAVRVEQMLSRDGLGLDETVRMLTVGRPDAPARAEIERVAERLPQRAPRRFESEAVLEEHASREPLPDALLENAERRALWQSAAAALEEVAAGLPAEDRLLLRMRFWQGLSVADIAGLLKLDAKPLYRRYERLLRDLRQKLTEHGIGPERAAELFSSPDISTSVNTSRVSVDTP